jgi:hypothetical protein
VARWTIFLAALFVAAVVGSLWVYANVDADAVQTAATLADILLALLLGLVTFRGRLAQRRSSPTPEQRETALRMLADEMQVRLRDDRRYRALTAPEPLATRWRARAPYSRQQALRDRPGIRTTSARGRGGLSTGCLESNVAGCH